MEKSDKLTDWSKLLSPPTDMIPWEGHSITDVVFLPRMHNHEGTSDKPQVRNTLFIKGGHGAIVFQNINIIKDKERLRKCSRLKEA